MPLPPTDPGPFISGLGWIQDLAQVPLNLAKRRPGAAGRKLVDLLGDIPDAVIPGDWMPHIGDEDPHVRPSDLLGIDPNVNPGIARATDIIGETVANPISYFGLRGGAIKAGLPLTEGTAIPGSAGLLQRGKDFVGRQYDRLPSDARKTISNSTAGVRRTLNLMDVPDEGMNVMDRAKGTGAQAGSVYGERVRQIYSPLTPVEQEAVGEIGEGIARNNSPDRALWTTIDDADAYLASRPDVRPDVVKQAIADRLASHRTQFDEGVDFGVMGRDRAVDDYTPRQWSGDYFNDISPAEFTQRSGTNNSPISRRVEELKSKEQRLKFLQDTPDVDLEFNALKADAKRAEQQGRLVQKAQLGKAVTGNKDFTLTDPDHQKAMTDAIAQIAKDQPDYAYRLENLYKGVKPRGDDAFSKVLHWGNKQFKQAATFGIALPRMSFNVGNRVSGLWQVLSNEQARGAIGPSSKRALSDLYSSVDDGIMKLLKRDRSGWAKNELSDSLDLVERATKEAKGDVRKFRELIATDPKNGIHLQEALDNGILNGFVDSEMLLAEMARTPKAQRVNDFMQWPASIAKGVEQRMRLGTWLDLRKQNIDPVSASKTIKDTFLDYDIPGVANRRFRDVVPFGAFLSQNIKQQAGFAARHPVVLAGAAPLFGEDSELPKYPYMDQTMAIPTGLDEEGNPQYLTSFRHPIEGLTSIPGWSQDDALRDVVGNTQPLLKSGLSWLFDRDSFTGGEYGEYDKIMGQSAGAGGRLFNNIKGSGLTQPITGPMDQFSNLIDDRKSIGERALQATTGLRFTSVDPDRARTQRIENYLDQNPEARQYTGYFQEGEDQGLSDLLKQLRESKEKLREKRKAAEAIL